jgi:hypothetical protein
LRLPDIHRANLLIDDTVFHGLRCVGVQLADGDVGSLTVVARRAQLVTLLR